MSSSQSPGPLPAPANSGCHPSGGSIPHEVAAGGLLVGEGLRAAQASLVPLHQVPDGRAAGAALAREGSGLGWRVGHAGSELQLQFHVLAQLGWRYRVSAQLPGPSSPFKSPSPHARPSIGSKYHLPPAQLLKSVPPINFIHRNRWPCLLPPQHSAPL